MPVYNGDQYLGLSISSILAQSFSDFELLIINDGSVDNTANILTSHRDERIRVINNPLNLGLSASLNKGLAAARGEFIARMDADDIAAPNRLVKQISCLESHPGVGIIGSSATIIDNYGKTISKIQMPASDVEIRWLSLFRSPFLHPSVMMRRELFWTNELRYGEGSTSTAVEDYELWVNLLKKSKGANIQEPLLHYRVHPASISSTNKVLQEKNHIAISLDALKNEFASELPTEEELTLLIQMVGLGKVSDKFQTIRPLMAQKYLELWERFSPKYKDQGGFNELQKGIAIKAARMAVYPKIQKKTFSVLKQISKIDKNWIWNFLSTLPTAMLLHFDETKLIHSKRT